jgi:hypothetical protein
LATIITMKQWGTMQDIFKTSSVHLTTALGRVGADPSRLMTIREWWYEMDEPVAMLADPHATFREDERNMIEQCRRDGINIASTRCEHLAYRDDERAAFPAWRLAMFYANP